MPLSMTNRRRVGFGAIALATAAGLALTGCTASSGGDEGGITANTGPAGDLTANFNPFSATADSTSQGLLYEQLFYYNVLTGADPKPMLGDKYEWNDDGTELTVDLRTGVQWSDGEDFTADDVAYTFQTMLDKPELNRVGFEGTVEATDDDTVVFTFADTSFVKGPDILGQAAIVPEHVFSKLADIATDPVEKPIGTGPYMLDTFTPQSYVYKANPNYWQSGKPEVKSIRYIALANNTSATDAIVGGDLDWSSIFIPEADKVLGSNPDVSYVATPLQQITLMTCSNADLGCTGPQTDPAVRQAIYKAMNRDQLNDLAFSGTNKQISPTFMTLGRDDDYISPDVEKETPMTADTAGADALLQSAGYAKGSDGIYAKDGQKLQLEIQVVTGYSDYIAAIDAMAEQLRAVGIEITQSAKSYNEWVAARNNGQFQLTMDSLGQGPSTDPYYLYNGNFDSTTTSPVGEQAINNFARYSNPTVDAAIVAAEQTDDVAAKTEQYFTIQKEIVADMPYIPVLLQSTLTEFNSAKVTGWPTGDDDTENFPATWKTWDNAQTVLNLKLK